MRARSRSPAATLLLVTLALLGQVASTIGGAFVPWGLLVAAAHKRVLDLPEGVGLLFGNTDTSRLRIAKLRAERNFIDFVELMWPVLDDPVAQPFVRTWVQEEICRHFEAVHAGKITKLLINVCPGFTKSRIAMLFTAWEWGPKNRPDLRYMAWSYSAKLSEEHNADCRKVIESPLYQLLWGDRFELEGDTNAKAYFKNSKGGWRRSSSVGGQSTGFRADRLLFDDPHNVKDADSEAALKEATTWFAKSLPTRVRNAASNVRIKVPYWVRAVHGLGLDDDPEDTRPITVSATIGIMQRVHLHDISGVILRNPALGYEILLIEMRYKGDEHPARKSPGWKPSSIGYVDPRTELGELADPIRFPEDVVVGFEAQMMIDGGTDAVAAQFDQWPLETSGGWFKVEWLPIIEPHEVPADVPIGKRGWDLGGGGKSTRSDPTANAHVARGTESKTFYLMHTATKRGSPGDLEAFIQQQHKDDPMSLDWSIPEDPGTGKLYADYIVREIGAGRFIHTSREAKDKITRAKPVSAQAQHANFVIVRHPGCELARAELVDFPYGDHDDIVDSISRAFMAVVSQPAAPSLAGGFGVVGN